MTISNEVSIIAAMMQQELDNNAHKGDWKEFTNLNAIQKELVYHLQKLWIELQEGNKEKAREYLADCCNCLLFVANSQNLLPTPPNRAIMTLKMFHDFGILAAKERGYDTDNINAFAINLGGKQSYSLECWTGKETIRGGNFNNPAAAVQAFKDALDYQSKTYSQITEDIELEK